MTATLTLDGLNAVPREDFVAAIGDVFEHAEWVAEGAYAARPFATVADLHEAMMAAVGAAPAARQLAFLRGHPKLLGSPYKFQKHGKSGIEISELLPHLSTVADDLCVVKSMHTEEINHGPAQLFQMTGFGRLGRPSMGAWVTYGIGSESRDLPGFVVLQSGPRGPRGGAVNWASGFLPSSYQGVPLRSTGDPIVDLRTLAGISDQAQRDTLDAVRELNLKRLVATGDLEISTRIAAYEMAYRMQTSAPEMMDLSGESKQTLDLYGARFGFHR